MVKVASKVVVPQGRTTQSSPTQGPADNANEEIMTNEEETSQAISNLFTYDPGLVDTDFLNDEAGSSCGNASLDAGGACMMKNFEVQEPTQGEICSKQNAPTALLEKRLDNQIDDHQRTDLNGRSDLQNPAQIRGVIPLSAGQTNTNTITEDDLHRLAVVMLSSTADIVTPESLMSDIGGNLSTQIGGYQNLDKKPPKPSVAELELLEKEREIRIIKSKFMEEKTVIEIPVTDELPVRTYLNAKWNEDKKKFDYDENLEFPIMHSKTEMEISISDSQVPKGYIMLAMLLTDLKSINVN